LKESEWGGDVGIPFPYYSERIRVHTHHHLTDRIHRYWATKKVTRGGLRKIAARIRLKRSKANTNKPRGGSEPVNLASPGMGIRSLL